MQESNAQRTKRLMAELLSAQHNFAKKPCVQTWQHMLAASEEYLLWMNNYPEGSKLTK